MHGFGAVFVCAACSLRIRPCPNFGENHTWSRNARTRAPVDPCMLARRYNRAEVETILRRAADLHGQAREGASLQEIEKIAEEAGISTALVRRAAYELAEPAPVASPRSPVFGGPIRTSAVRAVDTAWAVERFDELLPVLRQLGNGNGDAAVVGKTLTFTTKGNGAKATAEVAVVDGRTTIDVQSDLQEYATNMHVIGLLGLAMPALLIISLAAGPIVGVFAFGLITSAMLALGRTFVDRRAAQQAAVVERIADTLARDMQPQKVAAPRRARCLVKFSRQFERAPLRGRTKPQGDGPRSDAAA